MLVHEEKFILRYLRQHPTCSFNQILKACLPGAPDQMAERILQNLEWFGYITVFPSSDGHPHAIQITTKGKELL